MGLMQRVVSAFACAVALSGAGALAQTAPAVTHLSSPEAANVMYVGNSFF